MKKIMSFIFLIMMTLTLLSNTLSDVQSATESEWTILVYMAADSEREEYAVKAINQLEEVGSKPPYVNIVALIDRWDGYKWEYVGDTPVRVKDSRDYLGNDDITGTKAYYIKQDDSDNINSVEIMNDIEIDTADPSNLESFLNETIEVFPAKKYAVIIWGIGGGLEGALYDAMDDEFLPTLELARVFERVVGEISKNNEKNIELLGFDSAFMSMYEINNEFRKTGVKNTVGPEGNVDWNGFPYKAFLTELVQSIEAGHDVNGTDLAEDIVNKYIDDFNGTVDSQISACSLEPSEKYDNVNASIDFLAHAIMNNQKEMRKIHIAADESQRFYYPMYYVDLIDFMKKIMTISGDSIIKAAAEKVINAVQDYNIVQLSRNTGGELSSSNGIAIYFPLYRRAKKNDVPYLVRPYSQDKENYEKYSFAEDTAWNEMIETYYKVMERESDTNVGNTENVQINNSVLADVSTSSAPVTSPIPQPSPISQQVASSDGNGNVYQYPTPSHYVTSPYGWRTHPVYGTRKFHRGVDLRGANGSSLWAAADGRVSYTGYSSGGGNMIFIRHSNGRETRYMHCNSVSVRNGQNVNKGQSIGAVGSTGAVTGPHLHFETWTNNNHHDPISVMP